MLFALLGPFAFQLPRADRPPRLGSRTTLLRAAIPAFVPSDKVAELSEPACLQTLSAIEMEQIELPPTLATGMVTATYARTASPAAQGVPPVVLLHGFDSSCLEFRRLLPELEALGVEAYALDIFGWGFADTTNATGVGVAAKRAHLLSFQQRVLQGRPMTLVAVSLGAAVVVDFYAAHPDAVASTVLVDPQCMIDGTPAVPQRFARTGIKVLGSWPLRSVANQLAYYDTATLATDDAIRVGLLHCLRPGWEDDSIAWLLGGGYSVSAQVPRLASLPSCLILWGRQDEIIPPADYLPKFVAALPASFEGSESGSGFRWVEACGHSPHLEQPKVLAAAIRATLDGQPVAGDSDVSEVMAAAALSPLDKLNALLDTPLLDTAERGGPLEPFKSFARSDPEAAQVVASVAAVVFWLLLFRIVLGIFS